MSLFQHLALTSLLWYGGFGVACLQFFGVVEPPFYARWNVTYDDLELLAWYSLIYTATLFLLSRLFRLDREAGSILEPASYYLRKIPSRLTLRISIVLALIATLFYFDEIRAHSVERFFGNELISRIVLFVSAVLIAASIIVRKRPGHLSLLLSIYAGTLYPSLISSRSAAIPFLVATFSFLWKKKYPSFLVFAILSIAALGAAFQARSDPSYFNYWGAFFNQLAEFRLGEAMIRLTELSFPGGASLQVVTTTAATITASDVIDFLLYYSPIPSQFLPEGILRNQSLNSLIGVDRSVLGINTDIFSEFYLWFGVAGMTLGPMILGFMTVLPFIVLRMSGNYDTPLFRILAFISVLYMIAGGMVLSLRAGSRLVYAVIAMAFIYFLLKKLGLLPFGRGDRMANRRP